MQGEIFGFNIWTKNSPKDYIREFSDYAERRETPIVAVVDDVLPDVVFERSEEQSAKLKDEYSRYMSESGFSDTFFVSDLLPDRAKDLGRIVHTGNRVGVSSFISLLPEKKSELIETLSLTETIDTCWQLHVLEQSICQLGITRYLTGKRSTAIFRLAKRTINNFDFDIIDD